MTNLFRTSLYEEHQKLNAKLVPFAGWEMPVQYTSVGPSSSYRPSRPRFGMVNAKTVINPILTRIAVDVSTYDFRHVKNDDDERFVEEIKSGLNDCLNLEANIDQSSRE